MKFSDFKHLLGADPYSQDPEFLRARNQLGEFAEAAREADEFERHLLAAAAVSPPESLHDDIMRTKFRSRSLALPIAMAASLFLALGALAIMSWNQQRFASLDEYIISHYSHDGQRVERVAANTPVSLQEIEAIMASVGATSDPSLARKIRFLKNCPTPDGKGVHMVLVTESGPVTVIYMPNTTIEEEHGLTLEGKHAWLVALDQGAAALIGDSDEQLQQLQPSIRQGIARNETLAL